MLIALLLEFIFALAAAFTQIYGLYVALRFFVAMSVAGSFTSMFVLCKSCAKPPARSQDINKSYL